MVTQPYTLQLRCVCVCAFVTCTCVHSYIIAQIAFFEIVTSSLCQAFCSARSPEPNLLWTVKALLAFGATVNSLNLEDKTPLDIAYGSNPDSELVGILTALGGLNGEGAAFYLFNLPQLVIVAEPIDSGGAPRATPGDGQQDAMRARSVTVGGFSRYKYICKQPQEDSIRPGATRGDGYAAWKRFRKRRKGPVVSNVESSVHTASITSANAPLVFQVKEGERILCLDGGSMRGLIQIEILSYIEEVTQCKITELFDWIVGTSTGGVVALGLVYGKIGTLYSCLYPFLHFLFPLPISIPPLITSPPLPSLPSHLSTPLPSSLLLSHLSSPFSHTSVPSPPSLCRW